MVRIILFGLFAISITDYAAGKAQFSDSIYEDFKGAICPDVIDDVDPAIEQLKVDYVNFKVEMGKELAPIDTKIAPNVTWDAEEDKFYTLIMTDPDAPSRKEPIYREWQHWLVVNIPAGDLSKGETLSEYIGPGPPKGTGLHRYVFLLFMHPTKIQFKEEFKTVANRMDRKSFNTLKFSDKYNLGFAIGGDYFQAQWDPSVGS